MIDEIDFDDITAAYYQVPERLSFVVTTVTNQVDKVDGFGSQLPHLIEQARAQHRAICRGLVEMMGCSDAGIAGRTPDRIIWYGSRAVALMRALEDGTLAVIRFPESGYPVAVDVPKIGGVR